MPQKPTSLPQIVNDENLIQVIADRFPRIAASLDDADRTSRFMMFGSLAVATQVAISDEDVSLVQGYFDFVGEIYLRATPEIQNAIHVSYLERLSFSGRHGTRIRAREMLSEGLRTAFTGLESYNEQLAEAAATRQSEKSKPKDSLPKTTNGNRRGRRRG